MPYLMYLRKSRADVEAEAHGAGDTLARHQDELLRAAKRLNLPVSKIYREIVSGDSIAGPSRHATAARRGRARHVGGRPGR